MNNVGGSALTITKSKPLEGTELGATNPNTDFSEGSSIVPGAYDTASVLFSPQAAVINANTVYYSGTWTLNTDDLTWGVHTLNFTGSLYARQVGPLMSSGFSLYKYLGCYQDYVNNFRIEPKEYVNTANSNGLCQNQSLAFGSIFAGTEYQTECWIGTVIPPVSALVADTYCSYSCAGDSTQVCGGAGGYISIYYDSSRYFPANGTIIGATGLGPAIPQAVGGYSYAGCCKYSTCSLLGICDSNTPQGLTLQLQECSLQ
jgi:WSC domain